MRPVDPILVLLAAAALLFVPGWFVLLATRANRGLDAMLVPAAALTVSLALLAPSLALVLWIGASTWWCVGWLVACAAVAGAIAWRRRVPLQPLGTVRRVAIAGFLTVLVAAGGGALALWAGGDLRRDQVYHTQRVVKLAELDAPTFASASRIEGGGATTPYAFPLWHGAQAVVVRATGVEPMVLAWLLPALLVPISILAFAGLARVVVGGPEAGLAAAIAWGLLRIVDYVPDYRFLATAQWPGMVTAMIVVPLVCAMLVPALYEANVARRRSALAIGAVGTLVVIGLHGNYVLFPALLVGGALAWLVVWDRALVTRRAAVLCAAWGGAAVAGLLALLPVLLEHGSSSVDDGSVDALVTGSRNFNYFEQVQGGWALRLEPLASQPLTILAFAAAIGLVFFAVRSRMTALAAAGLAAVVACARLPFITESVLGLGNLTAVTRLWLAVAVPTTIALAVALLLVERLLRDPRTVRILLGLGLLAAGAWFSLRASNVTLMHAREVLVPALLATVGLGVVVGVIQRMGPTSFGGYRSLTRESRTMRLPTQVVVAGAVAVVAVFGATGVLLDGRFDHAVHRDPILGAAWDARAKLREALPDPAVVLADEQDSYVLPAIAPVYVVGDYKWWLERSDDTDTVERLEDVRTLLDPDTPAKDWGPLLERRQVDVMVLRSSTTVTAGTDRRIGPWLVADVD